MGAVETASETKDSGHALDAALVNFVEAAEVVVLMLGFGAPMVAGDVGDNFQFFGLKAFDAAVDDEVVRMFVVACVVDEVADVLHAGGRVEQVTVGRVEVVEFAEAGVDFGRQFGRVASVVEFDAALFGKAFDLGEVVGWGSLFAALHLFDQRKQQSVADAVGVDLDEVHFEAAHDAVDDGEARDDDVGTVGTEAGDFAALFDREFSEAVDEVAQLGPRNLAACYGEARLAFGGHHHVGQRRKGAAGADDQMRRNRNSVCIFFEVPVDPFLHAVEIFAGHRLPAAELFGESHCAEVGGVDCFDLFAGGKDHFGAAAADIGKQGVFSEQIKPPADAVEGEVGFFFGADHFDRQTKLLGNALAEVLAVGRFADGAGGDGVEAFDAQAGGDRLETSQGG